MEQYFNTEHWTMPNPACQQDMQETSSFTSCKFQFWELSLWIIVEKKYKMKLPSTQCLLFANRASNFVLHYYFNLSMSQISSLGLLMMIVCMIPAPAPPSPADLDPFPASPHRFWRCPAPPREKKTSPSIPGYLGKQSKNYFSRNHS